MTTNLPYGAAQTYIESFQIRVRDADPRVMAERVAQLVSTHDRWRDLDCLNLTPAENVMSRSARALLDSDMATRVAEGLIGAREYPQQPQNRYIDEVEAILVGQVSAMFDAPYVEWRPVSTSMANAIIFFALLSPGDAMVSISTEAGGNYSYQQGGTPSIAGVEVFAIPPIGDCYEFNLEACRELVEQHRPKLIVIGASYALFPPPVAKISKIAREAGAVLLFDAAHSSLFAATGEWPNPLDEGADLLTFSTHKLMSGPVGGMIVTRDATLAKRVVDLTFPVFMQTRDQNKSAAAAHAFCEMRAHGPAYARQIVLNAQALGRALRAAGFHPLAEAHGYSQGQQLVVDLAPMDARVTCQRWRDANILLSAEHLSRDRPGFPSGVRLTVQEVTRRGMREADMEQIAEWMAALAFGDAAPETVAFALSERLTTLQRIGFSFDS